MRRRSREIHIFNLSMLDVISGALGIFLIMVVVLLPYYKNDEIIQQLREEILQLQAHIREQDEELAERQRTIEEQRRDLQGQQQRISELERENQGLQERLAHTFLIVVIDWKTRKHDIDLHVIDPDGHEFYYQKQSFPGVPGELSEDTQHGPGVEAWEINQAQPGDYKVYYKFYDDHGNSESTRIKGRVYFRDGRKHFREITLSYKGEKNYVATITVNDEGEVTVH